MAQEPQPLAVKEQCAEAVQQGLERYDWSVSKVIGDSPVKGEIWSTLDILSMLYESDDLICSGTFYAPITRPIHHWQVEGLDGDLLPESNEGRARNKLKWTLFSEMQRQCGEEKIPG